MADLPSSINFHIRFVYLNNLVGIVRLISFAAAAVSVGERERELQTVSILCIQQARQTAVVNAFRAAAASSVESGKPTRDTSKCVRARKDLSSD